MSIMSKWAGHHDSSFTYKRYVEARPEDLRQGTEVYEDMQAAA
ncbi:hypothetical protein F9C11_05455 [Amycolatopsis sp. VS8301801F10]